MFVQTRNKEKIIQVYSRVYILGLGRARRYNYVVCAVTSNRTKNKVWRFIEWIDVLLSNRSRDYVADLQNINPFKEYQLNKAKQSDSSFCQMVCQGIHSVCQTKEKWIH